MAPTLVVVSGPPGSGKTTLAHAIARAIPCPVVSRDEIKEGMAHAHGADFQGGHGDPLTQRTLPLFFEALRLLVSSGVTVVAEAAFQDRLWRPELEPLTELAELRIVNCTVAPAVSFERAVQRSADNDQHRSTHGDSTLNLNVDDWARRVGSFERIAIRAPSIDVDTTEGYQPALPQIVAFINRAAP